MDIEELERRELQKKKLVVGALFALSLVLAMVFAYWMGALGLGPSRKLYVTYNFAGGVEKGSPVRLGGIRVGRVAEIHFEPGASELLRLELEVSRDAFGQISQDSQMFVNLAGLIGERYVEVVPGTGPKVEAGQTIRGVDPPRVDQLLSQGYGIFGDMRAFFNENKNDLKEIFNSLNDLAKNLNKVMANLSPDQRRELTNLLKNFSEMSGDLRQAVATVNEGVQGMKNSNAAQSWTHFQALLKKGDAIRMNDLRRLLLEDGVKVNFSSKKIVDEEFPAIGGGASSRTSASGGGN